MKKSKILAVLLALVMVLTCMPMMAFADGEISFTDISVGNRYDITFDAEDTPQYFRLTVPESGLYKLYLYQEYANWYDEYFYVGIYESTDFSSPSLSNLHWANWDTPDDDYQVYKLEAGTYYIKASNFNSGGTKNKLGFEFQKTDGWELNYNKDGYVGQWLWIGTYNIDSEEEATINKIVSSDKSIAEVKKDLSIKAKAVGTVTFTVDYTAPDGVKGQKDATVRIRKHPNQIKSLTVSGKKVNVSKNKCDYSRGKYKSTKASVKVALKSGWKITSVWAYMYTKSGNEKKVRLTKKMITKGTAFKFPKKYKYISIGFIMEKGDKWIDYNIHLHR